MYPNMHTYTVLASVLSRASSGNQLKQDKHYLGHPSSNGCNETIENLLLTNGITDMSVQKVHRI